MIRPSRESWVAGIFALFNLLYTGVDVIDQRAKLALHRQVRGSHKFDRLKFEYLRKWGPSTATLT